MAHTRGVSETRWRAAGAPIGRIRAGIIVVATVAVLIGVLSGCTGSEPATEPEPDGATSSIVPGSVGSPAIVWADNGRYAVVQFYRQGRYPSVAVWDSESDTTRVLDGYRVLFAETAAPMAWLEPATARETDESTWYDGLSDSLDHQPAQMVGLKLDQDGEPSARVSSKWHAWPGSGGYVAYPEISVLKGAGPSALWFNNKASSGEGVKAKLPETTNSFAPVGWSRSGAYFAIEELAREEDVIFPGYTRENPAPPRLLVVFEAATGKVTATAELPDTAVYGPGATWDATEDRLYWPVEPDPVTEGAGKAVIRTMTATGTAADAFETLGWERTGDLTLVYDAGVAGTGSKSALLAIEGGLFEATPSALKRVGDLAAMQAAVSPSGRLGRVRYAYDKEANTGWVELVVTDAQVDRVVWKSPAEDLSN